MLPDHIMTFCDENYRKNITSHPCATCNHPGNSECTESCQNCLDQIHWLRPGGRRDYQCANLLHYYTCKYFCKYNSEILYALEQINLSLYPEFRILSLGCGPAPDLAAIESINQEFQRNIFYRGVDRNTLWDSIHTEIANYFKSTLSYDINFAYQDIFQALDMNKPRTGYNILVLQYFISHLYNTEQISQINSLYEAIIEKVVQHRFQDSPFLVIINDLDSRNKGRDYFWPFYKKLMAAGCNVNATAKRFGSDAYLENSTQYPQKANKYTILDDFRSRYNCALECTSAQLILELR